MINSYLNQIEQENKQVESEAREQIKQEIMALYNKNSNYYNALFENITEEVMDQESEIHSSSSFNVGNLLNQSSSSLSSLSSDLSLGTLSLSSNTMQSSASESSFNSSFSNEQQIFQKPQQPKRLKNSDKYSISKSNEELNYRSSSPSTSNGSKLTQTVSLEGHSNKIALGKTRGPIARNNILEIKKDLRKAKFVESNNPFIVVEPLKYQLDDVFKIPEKEQHIPLRSSLEIQREQPKNSAFWDEFEVDNKEIDDFLVESQNVSSLAVNIGYDESEQLDSLVLGSTDMPLKAQIATDLFPGFNLK